MVLTQHVRHNGEISFVSRFPYHYGSHATPRQSLTDQDSTPFPYHYGSHATNRRLLDRLAPNASFHTTMVLTQLEMHAVVVINITSFHTTMVLTQPRKKDCRYYSRLCFHTTMVLTQPLLLQRYYTGF